MLHRGLHVWSFKRYCVAVNDSWATLRLFWTLEGAKKFYKSNRLRANVFKWNGEQWAWVCGAKDLEQPRTTPRTRFELAGGWHLARVQIEDHFEWIICDPNGDRLGGTLKHLAELDDALQRQ